MNLGTISAQGGALLAAPIRKLTVDVVNCETIGWRCPGRLLVIHCTPRTCEVRNYAGARQQVLVTLAGGRRRLECEDTGERLKFRVDDEEIVSLPRGRLDWQLFRFSAK